jgi:2-(1,2-epoxy-1,2-dihydrophenyl)acetyl-CoA isomerase
MRGTNVPEMLHDRVRWELDDRVARLTLARPHGGNALDMAMTQGLGEAADRVAQGAANGSIRVAVLAAEGQTFCVGGDLRELAEAERRDLQVAAVADAMHRIITVLRQTSVPVVSVVHGTVAGGGIGLALAADVVLMAAEAKMRLAYTAGGLSPDCGSTWFLTQRIGSARALDLALSNRVLTGREAADWGLVSRAVSRQELNSIANDLVAGLRAGPAAAYAETKRLIEAAHHRTLFDQLTDESATIAGLITGPDAVEGVDAFLAKRPAVFL